MSDRITTIVRERVGRRCRITRGEMAQILRDLQGVGLELANDCVSDASPEGWAARCRRITCVSVLAAVNEDLALAGRYHGLIRYDDPGSMHPLFRARLMFAPASLERSEYDQIGQLRRRIARGGRLLIVECE